MASGAAGIDLVGRMPGLRHPSVLSAMTRAVASARDAILVVAKVLLLLSRRRRPQPAAELRRLLPAATSRHGEIRGGVEMVRGGVEGGGGRSVEVGSGGCRRRVAEGRGGAQVNARQRDPSKPTFKDGAASQLYLVVKNEVGSGGCRRRVAEGRGGAQVNALQRDPSKPAFKDRAARQLNLVVKNEGWERLYGGLMASLVGTAASQGVYYYFYQIFRNRAEAKALERSRRGLGYGSVGMIQSLTVAALSGCINVLITNPIWVDVHECKLTERQTDSKALRI